MMPISLLRAEIIDQFEIYAVFDEPGARLWGQHPGA